MKRTGLLFFAMLFVSVAIGQNSDSLTEAKLDEERKVIELAGKAWDQIESKDFSAAVISCNEGLKLDSENYYLLANLAHASLLAGDYESAITIYRKYYGKPFNETMTWKEMIKTDFDALISKGLDAAPMNKVLEDLKSFE